jgi:hypothetical protein
LTFWQKQRKALEAIKALEAVKALNALKEVK